jgi:hypothetical protein
MPKREAAGAVLLEEAKGKERVREKNKPQSYGTLSPVGRGVSKNQKGRARKHIHL